MNANDIIMTIMGSTWLSNTSCCQNSKRCTPPRNTWIQKAEIPRQQWPSEKTRPLMVRRTLLSVSTVPSSLKRTCSWLSGPRSAHLQAPSSCPCFQLHPWQWILEGKIVTTEQSLASWFSPFCLHFLPVIRAGAQYYGYPCGMRRLPGLSWRLSEIMDINHWAPFPAHGKHTETVGPLSTLVLFLTQRVQWNTKQICQAPAPLILNPSHVLGKTRPYGSDFAHK